MTDVIDNSGSAFPYNVVELKPDGSFVAHPHHGMTLRDWFAGQALAGWLASYGDSTSHPVDRGREAITAADAYAMADAMLAARKGGQ
jgi:hypothetical protein